MSIRTGPTNPYAASPFPFEFTQIFNSDVQLKLKPYKSKKKSAYKISAARVIDISASLIFVSHLWPKL